MGGIGIDDGGALARQHLLKQAKFGRQIVCHRGEIVEMVASKVGKGGRAQHHAIQPVLIEPV